MHALPAILLAATVAASGQALVPGAPIERELRGGEAHSYDLDLEAGQFLQVVVTPSGTNVAATLVGPDGTELCKADLSVDLLVAETVMAVTPQAGRYRLQVKPAGEQAAAGRYRISIEPVRPAIDGDTARVRAMRSLEAGVRLRDSGENRAWERALEPLAAARTEFRDAGDVENEAKATLEHAITAMFLRQPEALAEAREARDLHERLGLPLGVARALYAIGLSHQTRSELSESLEALNEALSRSQALGSVTLEVNTRNALGIVYGLSGNHERAAESLQHGLRLARGLGRRNLERVILNNLGIATKDLGDFPLAIQYYEEALRLARSASDRVAQLYLLGNLGNAYRTLSEYQKALAVQTEGLELSRQMGNTEGEARALNTIGLTHYRLGAFATALDHHTQALAIRRRMQDLGGQASSLDGAGVARHRLGDHARAVEDLSEALRIRRATAERQAESDVLLHLALVERDRGNLETALEHVTAAVQLTDALRGQVISPDLRASYAAVEHDRYEAYIDVLMRLHKRQPDAGFDTRALEASERGRARVLLESLLEARTDIRQGIDPGLVESERRYQRQLGDASARMSRMLIRQAEAKEIDAARTAMETLSTEYRQLQVRIRQESPAYAALTQARPATLAEIQRDLLDPNTVLLEYALGDERSWLWAITTGSFSSLELPARQEIEPAARRVYELLTARQPRPAESAAARAARIRIADDRWRRGSAALGRMLLGPAAARLGGEWRGKRLLIVAPDILQYIPFSVLSDPADERQPLIVDHEVVSLPSASVLAALRQQTDGRAKPLKQVAVFADPVFEADDPRLNRPAPAKATDTSTLSAGARAMRSAGALGSSGLPRLSRLPFSRQEARAIATLVPASQRLEATDFAASRAAALGSDLSSYRIVHFATHGFLNSEQPELSGLVLSLVDQEGNAQDGFLRLNDIYNLRLPADVVVLSACQTALGKELRGEGLVGLTRGFMYAGARRVVASLWQVDDLATAELMRVFYRGMLKDNLSPAAALRAAQRELARQPRWSSPFYWSAFVLQGEYM